MEKLPTRKVKKVTKRKLKSFVKPTLFIICITTILLSSLSIIKNLKPTNEVEDSYVVNPIIDNVTPVVDTVEEKVSIIKPYTNESVKLAKSFYDKDASVEEQQQSLIYYENTYWPNSGVVYSNAEEFDCVAVLDGTVIDIKQDEILNTVVYVSHNNNLTTIYYGLKDVNLKVNDAINQKDVIGKSTTNKFCSESNSILFEVNYNGSVLNPEKFYTMNLDELN